MTPLRSYGADGARKINLDRTAILVMDGSPHGLEILVQILSGFGAKQVERAGSVRDAEKAFEQRTFDLVIADPDVPGEDGFRLLQRLRSSKREPNCYAPIILVTGHTRLSNVQRARDIGANIVVAKPVSSKVLLERILWVASDPRPFVEINDYIGPDRRFKFAGPPPGTDGRRAGDLPAEVGDASTPNMNQSEVDSLIKPQRVAL